MSANVRPNRVGPFPFPRADGETRKENFSEVEQSYTREEVMLEADRCLRCGNPVCMDACPVQMDVRGMCDAVAGGDFEKAYHRIKETNALLGVTARCCPQLQGLCEDACVMRWQGQPISIGMIQKFVADWEQNEARQPDPSSDRETGKRIAVVGAGPCGLAASSLLRRYGHTVTIYEELATPGGTAWYGVPDYHLPKDTLLYEIERIKGLGVEIKTGVKVGRDTTLSELLTDSDVVLITTGCKDVTKLDTPGIALKGVYDGYGFLEDVYVNGVQAYLKTPRYELGKDILVIGGGDSALDAARTALRLSQGNVTIVYRRTQNEMPADPIMVDEAEEEGVKFMFLTDVKKYNGPADGRLTGATMSPMELGAPDETGRKKPEPIPGKEFDLNCDSVLLAVGRGPNSFLQKQARLKTGKKNSIQIDDHYRTSMQNVFAAGDVTTGETLVVKTMGRGREAAQRVHEYLMGLEDKHVSLYEYYYKRKITEEAYQDMLFGKEETLPPP